MRALPGRVACFCEYASLQSATSCAPSSFRSATGWPNPIVCVLVEPSLWHENLPMYIHFSGVTVSWALGVVAAGLVVVVVVAMMVVVLVDSAGLLQATAETA